MGNLGGMEIVVILLVALIVLGPTKLPEAARQVGKAVTEVRRISSGFQRELREAIHEPIQEAEAMARGADIARPDQPKATDESRPDQPLANDEFRPDQPLATDESRPDQPLATDESRPDQPLATDESRPDTADPAADPAPDANPTDAPDHD